MWTEKWSECCRSSELPTNPWGESLLVSSLIELLLCPGQVLLHCSCVGSSGETLSHLVVACDETISLQTFPQVEVTVGMDKEEGGKWPYAGTAAEVQAMGAKHVNKDVTVSFYYNTLYCTVLYCSVL